MKNNKGFTLIELIIVIVILGVLVTLAGPKLMGSVKNSKITAVYGNIKNIEKTAARVQAESLTGSAPTPPEIKAGIDKLNDAYTIVNSGFLGNGSNTTLQLNISVNGDKLGVTAADLTDTNMFTKSGLGGSFISTNTVSNMIYQNNFVE